MAMQISTAVCSGRSQVWINSATGCPLYLSLPSKLSDFMTCLKKCEVLTVVVTQLVRVSSLMLVMGSLGGFGFCL